MSESKKPASPIPPPASTQCCNSLTDTQCPALQVTPRMLRSPSHESVTTDLSLFSVSSIASELRGVNRLVTFKSYTDVHLTGRGPSPKPDSRQIQSNRYVLWWISLNRHFYIFLFQFFSIENSFKSVSRIYVRYVVCKKSVLYYFFYFFIFI